LHFSRRHIWSTVGFSRWTSPTRRADRNTTVDDNSERTLDIDSLALANIALAPPLDFSEFDLAANFGLLPIGS
jgi:hypothetical protein